MTFSFICTQNKCRVFAYKKFYIVWIWRKRISIFSMLCNKSISIFPKLHNKRISIFSMLYNKSISIFPKLHSRINTEKQGSHMAADTSTDAVNYWVTAQLYNHVLRFDFYVGRFLYWFDSYIYWFDYEIRFFCWSNYEVRFYALK